MSDERHGLRCTSASAASSRRCHDGKRLRTQSIRHRPRKYRAMDGIHVPTATAVMTPMRPSRRLLAAMPPKIGFASSNTMLVRPSTTYFHNRWIGETYSAYEL